jgi:hypothetical protein
MPFLDTKEVSMVLEIPPVDDGTIVGTVMDYWKRPLEDMESAGADDGKSGKYPNFTARLTRSSHRRNYIAPSLGQLARLNYG